MTERPVFNGLRRVAPDALAGLLMFLVLVASMAAHAGLGSGLELAAQATPVAAGGRPGTLILLAAVLSGLAAFDLAVFRHVYRVSNRPRRNCRNRIRSNYPDRS